jgi:glycine cleavage system H protein
MAVKPQDLYYAKTHEWVGFSTNSAGEPIATVGISAFAVEALTDLVYMELPAVGRQLAAGQTFGEIESVKAVSDLYSPVAGEVVEVNQALASHLETLNTDPYNGGWMIKVKVADDSAKSSLMDFPAYEKQCAEEGH